MLELLRQNNLKLIVALGNPTPKYENTRHNVGFMALQSYLKINNLTLEYSKKLESNFLKQDNVIFLEPQTFMNLSGIAVQKVCAFYKISEMLVLHDDLDLNLGGLKFKFGGSSGGHNGIKSIDEYVGSGYIRLRIGIGHPKNIQNLNSQNLKNLNSKENIESSKAYKHNKVIDFVLERFSQNELEVLESSFEIISKALDSFILGIGLQQLQNLYTKRQAL